MAVPKSQIDQIEDAQEIGMTPEDLQEVVEHALQDAISYIDSEIAPDREDALKYYRGDPFGDEEEGRSAFVSRDLHDTAKAILPSLMRVFFGSERTVEYLPRGPEDVANAEQATDYANFIVHQDNDGYLQFQSAFKDALLQKAGIIKWWWDEAVDVTSHRFSGLDDMAVALILKEPGVEVVALDADQMGQNKLEVRRKYPCNRFKFEALPPEEFIIDPWAKSIDTARLVAHRTTKTVSDLVAMGYDKDQIEEYVSSSDSLNMGFERINRLDAATFPDSGMDSASQPVLYCEAYIKVDYDGDGIAELRRVCTMGEGYEIVSNEPWDHRPFADFCVDPTAHTFFGEDLYDETKDIQRVQSELMRRTLDGIALSLYPRTAVVEGQVNIKDVLNPEVGAIIRMRAPGMFQPFEHKFNAQNAFAAMEYVHQIRDARTGVPRDTVGITADRLQSTTAVAVDAAVQGAQQTLELIARNFAERGMKRFYKGLLRTIVQHQDKERVVRLRNEWVPVDPRGWNATMDVGVNVVLGAGLARDRIMTLQRVAEAQKEALMQMGPNNPICGLGHLTKTLNKMTELSGFKDKFFNELPEDFKVPEPPPKPSVEEMLAQAQMADIQTKAQIEGAKLQQKRESDIRDAALKLVEIEANTQKDMAKALLDAETRLRQQSARD